IKAITKGIVKFGEYLAGESDFRDFYVIGFYVDTNDSYQKYNLLDPEIQNGIIIGNIYENPELMKNDR
ncbi:MAG: YopX family protein, partial [Candidatus Marinimicrobia bacterium]|nr:YopX family protein [Candidatus Neomarinimicrobiota bacterium]